MIIIGITGTLGAGKGTIVEHLIHTYGFKHYSVRSYLIKEIERRGLPVNRDNTTMVANDLRATHHSGYLIEQLYEEAKKGGNNAIIESIRTPGEVELLKNKGNFYLCAIDADPHIRYQRILSRQSELDNVTFEKFISDEKRELDNTDPTKQNINGCIKQAHFVFTNNGTVEDLHAEVDRVIKKIIN